MTFAEKLPDASRATIVDAVLVAVAFDEIVGLPPMPSALVIDRPVPLTAIERVAAVPAPVRTIRPLPVRPAMAVRSASRGCASVMP